MMSSIRRRCADQPVACAAAGVAALVGGSVLVWFAAGRRELAIGAAVVLAGSAIGAVGLLLVNEPIGRLVRTSAGRALGWVLGVVVLLAGVIALVVAVRAELPLVALQAVAVLAVGLLVLFAWISERGTAAPRPFLVLGAIGLAAAPALGSVAEGVDRRSITALAVGIAGLVLFKIGLPPWIGEDAGRRRSTIVASVAGTVAGLVLIFVATQVSSRPALLVGLTLAVAGLSALGIGLARLRPSLGTARIALAGGVVLAVAGFVLALGVVRVIDLTLVASVVVAAIGAWFIFRGEALVAILLAGFAVAWVLVDRVADEPRDPGGGDAELQLVALGDSYISGEGAPRYFEGTNRAGPDGNQCRRAPTAYPWLVADRLDAGLRFLACAGARADALDGIDPDLPSELPPVPGDEDQLLRLLRTPDLDPGEIDAVLVGIGGNDVRFSDVVKACLLPDSCADRRDDFLAEIAEVGPTLEAIYATLRTELGAETPIVVVPYPLILTETSCRLGLDASEHAFVVELTTLLDAEIEGAARAAGVHVVPGILDAFDGRLLCQDDPVTNFIHLSPTRGPIFDRLVPTNWVHGSMHPRPEGHALLADRLAPAGGGGFLRELLDEVAAGGPANPDPVPRADPGDDGADDGAAMDEVAFEEWLRERLYRSAWALVPPVALLLVGGLAIAFGIINLGWTLGWFLHPLRDRVPATTPTGSSARRAR